MMIASVAGLAFHRRLAGEMATARHTQTLLFANAGRYAIVTRRSPIHLISSPVLWTSEMHVVDSCRQRYAQGATRCRLVLRLLPRAVAARPDSQPRVSWS
jgi:hypothetical protein